MIPSIVAGQVRAAVVDYLRTSFGFSDPTFEQTLFEYLEGARGLFKGPYVNVRLPFSRAPEGERIPLELKPAFQPYAHQLRSFERLSSYEGHQPQHTLVTTGTGSGKTECFLYPILDHCRRHRQEPGIKALLLYPMNALASDQARRLAAELQRPELEGVSAGMYVGGKGSHGVTTAEALRDIRKTLRDDPPDILLTNYKMLDFLLLRPEDARLWRQNTRDSLRYLVIDELHTYDGAQGADVACLIRRLRARLDTPKYGLACVGTSATLGGSDREDPSRELRRFAETLFGVSFDSQSVIVEQREPLDSVCERAGEDESAGFLVPDNGQELDARAFASKDDFLRHLEKLWFRDALVDDDRRRNAVASHPFLRSLLSCLGGRPRSLSELARLIAQREPEFAALSPTKREQAIDGFVSLISETKDAEDRPFLSVQVQLWMRELRRLVQRVPSSPDDSAQFAFADDFAAAEDGHAYLGIARCIECGGHGFATYERTGDGRFSADVGETGRRWVTRSIESRYLTLNPQPDDQQDLLVKVLDPKNLSYRSEAPATNATSTPWLPISVSPKKKTDEFRHVCPDCGVTDGLSILGARAASLLSVSITELFHSEFNADPKLLAFTDSVQDASHRAGFFSARTHRFNLRTAFMGGLELSSNPVALAELHKPMLEFARNKMAEPAVVATLLPPDLLVLPEIEQWQDRTQDPPATVRSILSRRLSWEATLEFGLDSRRGRTLARTGCAVAYPDIESLEQASLRLYDDIHQREWLSPGPDESRTATLSRQRVRYLLAAIVKQFAHRGAIHHEYTRRYVSEGGNPRRLSKKSRAEISALHPRHRPHFIVDGGRHRHFDPLHSTASSPNAFRDLVCRIFKVPIGDENVRDVLQAALHRLTAEGVLEEVEAGRGNNRQRVFGLSAHKLWVHANPTLFECDKCARRVAVPEAEEEAWLGQVCLRVRCGGHLVPLGREVESYYQRMYRSGRLQRIYAQEHTGLLERADREALETRFKKGTEADAPNVLVATPTLEMGIDIGDLSAVALCSVPRTPANYLQRVGRAGRKTGNAFTVTVASAMPHDLYFFAEPEEMLDGHVVPPGAYLAAPYMLRRQLVAFAMDRWACVDSEAVKIPRKVRFVFSNKSPPFFVRFAEYFEEHRDELVGAFRALFADVDALVLDQVEAHAAKVPESVVGAFQRVSDELKDLRNRRRVLVQRKQKTEAKPQLLEEDTALIDELDQHRRMVERLIAELSNKYPLNVLTDEGVLPNYAFPEPGVTLQSVVRSPRAASSDAKATYQSFEYMRPASSAIRELAPFNSFYAGGLRVAVDEIDTGHRGRNIENYRFCPECAHQAAVDSPDETPGGCPRCGSKGWADQGQLFSMVRFTRARSFSDKVQSLSVDQHEDRQREGYEVLTLIDVAPDNYSGAELIESVPFGVEYLRDVPLTEVNFGFRRHCNQPKRVAAQLVPEESFEVCHECGKVRAPQGGKSKASEIEHAPFCRYRQNDKLEAKTDSVALYRRIRSEAIRMLLPTSTVDVLSAQASLKAALDLGFRRQLGGHPAHLMVRAQSEPLAPGSKERRNFLVVYDVVPGGTGYLASVWKSRSEDGGLLKILERAHEVMRSCSCRTDETKDGCHRCLLAYQAPRELPQVSRKKALDEIGRILAARSELKGVPTLSTVDFDHQLESELEVKFRDAVKAYAQGQAELTWRELMRGGVPVDQIQFENGHTWQLDRQVTLGSSDGVAITTRPDFLLRPLGDAVGVKPVAVYCDGLAFHALPEEEKGRIHDDLDKRQALIESGKFVVWTVTWKDVGEFANKIFGQTTPALMPSLEPHRLRQVLMASPSKLGPELVFDNSVRGLFRYLEAPDQSHLRKLSVDAIAAVALDTWNANPVSAKGLHAVELRLRQKSSRFLPEVAAVDQEGAVVGATFWLPWACLHVQANRQKLMADREDVTLIWRMFDEHAARTSEEFEASWREAWRNFNWLQFHPRLEPESSERLQLLGGSRGATPALVMAAESATGNYASDIEEIVETLKEEVLDDACFKLAETIVRAQQEIPVAGYEVIRAGRITDELAELAWPDRKLAVITSEQADARPLLEAEDWTVLDSQTTSSELLKYFEGSTP